MSKKKNNKNILLLIYALFAFLILITSFGNGIMDYFVLTISYLFVEIVENISDLSVIIEYSIIALIYLSLGIISLFMFSCYFSELKYVIIYSLIVNVALIVFSMIIKSFYELDVIKYLVKVAFSMVGVLLALIIELIRVKK